MNSTPQRRIETHVEIQLLGAFVSAAKRERYIAFVTSKQRRGDFLSELHHFRHFDPRWIRKVSGARDSPGGVIRELKQLGAAEECYVISADRAWDMVRDSLELVIEQIYGRVEATIVSCIPELLAYYEGEGPYNRFILHRPPP